MRRTTLRTRFLRTAPAGGDIPTAGGGGAAPAGTLATPATPAAPAAPATTAAPAGAPLASHVVPPTPAAPATPAPPAAAGIEAFPEEAQKVIRDLRQESQRYRQGAEEAAEQAKKELAQTIGKALGLVADEAADPAKLADALKTSQAAQTETARELAVFKAAATAGADPARLLDSRSFLAAIANIDPAKTDEITAAIKTAVQANPTLGAAALTAGASTVDHAGGSGEPKPQKTLAEALKGVYGG